MNPRVTRQSDSRPMRTFSQRSRELSATTRREAEAVTDPAWREIFGEGVRVSVVGKPNDPTGPTGKKEPRAGLWGASDGPCVAGVEEREKMKPRTQLDAFLLVALTDGRATLAELCDRAKRAGFKENERAIEEAVFLIADSVLDTPAKREANRARLGEKSESWPRGQSAEILAVWRSISWHLGGDFSAKRSTKAAK
jgi:hypothetical protein